MMILQICTTSTLAAAIPYSFRTLLSQSVSRQVCLVIMGSCFDSKTQNEIFCKSLAWYTKCSQKINRITPMDCKSRDESNEPN